LIFEIKPTCFEEHPKTLQLLKMADLVLMGRHRLYIEDESQPEYLAWKSELRVGLSEVWDQSLRYSMEVEALETAEHTIHVCEASPENYSASIPEMDVDCAARLAAEPFRVFVENDDADRDFLLTFSNTQQMGKIKELEDANLLKFEHCGGITELPKKVSKFAGKAGFYSKISAAIFDSDAIQPNENSEQADKAEKACTDAGVIAFVLKRRAIENYLLRSWLNTWVNESKGKRKRYVELYNGFCQLTDEQRAHFHVKKGLKADRDEIKSGKVTLYSGIPAPTQAKLEVGFGSDVGSDLFSADWVQESQSTDDPGGRGEVFGIIRSFLVLCR